MTSMLGKTVLYTLNDQDAGQVNRRRTTKQSIAERIALQTGTDHLRWPLGAQAHIGSEVFTGDVCPMIIVKVDEYSNKVNGQVFLDGTDTLWVENTPEGFGCGTWVAQG